MLLDIFLCASAILTPTGVRAARQKHFLGWGLLKELEAAKKQRKFDIKDLELRIGMDPDNPADFSWMNFDPLNPKRRTKNIVPDAVIEPPSIEPLARAYETRFTTGSERSIAFETCKYIERAMLTGHMSVSEARKHLADIDVNPDYYGFFSLTRAVAAGPVGITGPTGPVGRTGAYGATGATGPTYYETNHYDQYGGQVHKTIVTYTSDGREVRHVV